MIQRFLAIKCLLEGLLKVVKIFTISTPMPSGIITAMIGRESTQTAVDTVQVKTSVNGVGSQHLRSQLQYKATA